MAVARHDLQVGQQRGVVQRRGYLTYAAAVHIHGLAVNIAGCRIPAGLGALIAQRLVIAEPLAGIEHRAVNHGGRLADIHQTAPGAAGIGGIGAQQVGKEMTLQIFFCDLGDGHLGRHFKFLTRLRLVH